MKVKRLLSKLGIIAICLVMGICSIVGSSAAEAGSEVSKGNKISVQVQVEEILF